MIAGIAQLVEHNLAKVGVASSSLVSRSKLHETPTGVGVFALATWQSGYAADCKSVYLGSTPGVASTHVLTCPLRMPGCYMPPVAAGRR
jgi:hypothetical protein